MDKTDSFMRLRCWAGTGGTDCWLFGSGVCSGAPHDISAASGADIGASSDKLQTSEGSALGCALLDTCRERSDPCLEAVNEDVEEDAGVHEDTCGGTAGVEPGVQSGGGGSVGSDAGATVELLSDL